MRKVLYLGYTKSPHRIPGVFFRSNTTATVTMASEDILRKLFSVREKYNKTTWQLEQQLTATLEHCDAVLKSGKTSGVEKLLTAVLETLHSNNINRKDIHSKAHLLFGMVLFDGELDDVHKSIVEFEHVKSLNANEGDTKSAERQIQKYKDRFGLGLTLVYDIETVEDYPFNQSSGVTSKT
ncbi:MAG: hypothetical protein M3R00_01030 [Pseudomonadota bacterium]|nr:hypothetical protein [Pseudomonadota bacterium]